MKNPLKGLKRKLVKKSLGVDLDQKMFYEIGGHKKDKEIVFLKFYSEPLTLEQMQKIWKSFVEPFTKKPFSTLLADKKYAATKDQIEKMESILTQSLKPMSYFKGKAYKVITIRLTELEFNDEEDGFVFAVLFKGVRYWG